MSSYEEDVLKGLGAYAPADVQREHRWRWLIQSIGYTNFAKVAALPPSDRRSVLEQLARKLGQHQAPADLSAKDVEIVRHSAPREETSG
jgi:hypothetical protein